ncbi:hypothetical protein [Halovenus halobia]|uniref:hypothetical protein n=1 Tax=Halovenus halobia TaxID=3396622 RepID=UPI003F55F417
MRHDEFSRSEIPSEGVEIGGEDDCAHETYRRFGSDGGGNIYFRCTGCDQVILNYDTTEPETHDGVDPDLTPDSNTEPKVDPLMMGLSMDDTDSRSGDSQQTGFLARIRSDLDRLLPWRRD